MHSAKGTPLWQKYRTQCSYRMALPRTLVQQPPSIQCGLASPGYRRASRKPTAETWCRSALLSLTSCNINGEIQQFSFKTTPSGGKADGAGMGNSGKHSYLSLFRRRQDTCIANVFLAETVHMFTVNNKLILSDCSLRQAELLCQISGNVR